MDTNSQQKRLAQGSNQAVRQIDFWYPPTCHLSPNVHIYLFVSTISSPFHPSITKQCTALVQQWQRQVPYWWPYSSWAACHHHTGLVFVHHSPLSHVLTWLVAGELTDMCSVLHNHLQDLSSWWSKQYIWESKLWTPSSAFRSWLSWSCGHRAVKKKKKSRSITDLHLRPCCSLLITDNLNLQLLEWLLSFHVYTSLNSIMMQKFFRE